MVDRRSPTGAAHRSPPSSAWSLRRCGRPVRALERRPAVTASTGFRVPAGTGVTGADRVTVGGDFADVGRGACRRRRRRPVAAAHACGAGRTVAARGWPSEFADDAAGRASPAAPSPCRGDVGPGAAAVWGLVRSAQAEHPGRFALVDLDGDERSPAGARAARTSRSSRCATARILVPRLVRAAAPERRRQLGRRTARC